MNQPLYPNATAAALKRPPMTKDSRAALVASLRQPVTRLNAEVTLLAERALSAADEIERLERQVDRLREDLRDSEREARAEIRDAVAEAEHRGRMGDDYHGGCY